MKSFIGIDWSEKHHDVRVHNAHGACLARFQVDHTLPGFQQLHHKLQQLNPQPAHCLVALETHDTLLVDFLGDCGYTLYVLAPSRVARNRGRHRASGAKDDDHDAYVLADLLRTDHRRLLPWRPNSPVVRQLRLRLSAIDDLTGDIVRQHNRLRAYLLRYYPQALSAFQNLQTHIALDFLVAFPTPQAAQALSYEQFYAFCRTQGYHQYRHLPGKYAALIDEAPQADPAIAAASQAQVAPLARRLRTLLVEKTQALQAVETLFSQHEDAPLFDSLPGAGQMLAPKLLVMFGDRRERYPDYTILQGIAGTAPVTRQSGQARWVAFRQACNRSYRRTMQQFARCSITQSVWAAGYYQQAKKRNLSDSHAYRCLANRWVRIIWTLWQRREPYDERQHLRDVHHGRRQLVPA